MHCIPQAYYCSDAEEPYGSVDRMLPETGSRSGQQYPAFSQIVMVEICFVIDLYTFVLDSAIFT